VKTKRNKFNSRLPKPGTKEREEIDQRFRDAVARLEADPEYIALQAACRRADKRGPNVKCTV
jgi:hypothetical protein